MDLKRLAFAGVIAGASLAATPGLSSANEGHQGSWHVGHADEGHQSIPRYHHIVEIMMENTNFSTIIGNTNAPQINALAAKHGLATNYYGVTHPSEPNYVANIGGDYFGIQDDNQFYCTAALASTDVNCAGTTVDHTVSAPNLATQLTANHLTWKGYFQSLPAVPSTGVIASGPNANGPYTFKSPSNANALYASKHNPFINFTSTQGALANMVPDTQLATDLASGHLPSYSLVVPDQCHDMHGTSSCSDENGLISAGDSYVGSMVQQITSSHDWREGNNAIVVTWDEDDYADSGQPGTGCCGSTVGGGKVVTLVITNHHEHPIQDATPYNHYSLLKSIEQAFDLPYLAHAGDQAVPAMTPLFRNED